MRMMEMVKVQGMSEFLENKKAFTIFEKKHRIRPLVGTAGFEPATT